MACGPARAQSDAGKIDAVPAPRSDISVLYQADAARAGNKSDAVYARRITGALPLAEPARPQSRSGPLLDGPMAMILVFVLVLGGLALWLRFGGGGGLLSGAPAELRKKPAAPDGWRLPADANRPSGDLLAEIAAMADRRAGLVRLLRHCLLHAADATDTRFARSDTERSALRRLPDKWAGRADLAGLLTAAELAHYGGRSVAEDEFARSLATAGRLLGRNRGAHA